MVIHSQLVATKFFVPATSGTLIPRSRLTTLLQESLTYPVTLVSAPAGFGKTTLLSTWARSLPPSQPLVAWVALDEEDNDPRLFWTYVLNALEMQNAEGFTSLLRLLQSPTVPSMKYILTGLINLLANHTEHFLLLLDDYHVIKEQEIHNTLSYLVEYLPPQLHIVLATREDPPLPLQRLRARRQVLEIHTEQLRCTVEETKTFFKEMIGSDFANETIQEVRARTEGWLVGLHLLALSLRKQTDLSITIDPLTILEATSGDQRYILDYLTEEVLRRQPQEIQTFLLSTSILDRLTAPLCDAVTLQANSQQTLERIEQSNLFVRSLDSKRQWYRYHALFAEALRSLLEQTQGDLMLDLHHRASLWYAQHDQTTEAILHAFRAHQWQWAADLLERKSLHLMSLTWGAGQHALSLLQKWIEQLPAEVMQSRPLLCLACTQLLWTVTDPIKLNTWLDAAETSLTDSLAALTSEDVLYSTLPLQEMQQQEQLRRQYENRLGEIFTFRAIVQSHEEDAHVALLLCQQALALLSTENLVARAFVAWAKKRALYISATNNAVAAIESGLQSSSLAQVAGKNALAIGAMGSTAMYMIGAGQLHEVEHLTQQAIQLGTQPDGIVLPDVCWPNIWQAEVLRQRNKLDVAQDLIEEALSLSPQVASMVSITYSLYGQAVLLRISLSRGNLDAAHAALEQFERISMRMNQPLAIHSRAFFTTVDQVRLWLACGELKQAIHWTKKLNLGAQHGSPFAHEREEVACARILLTTGQPLVAIKRLDPVLIQATAGQRWGDIIEIRILQALAYHMCHYDEQALSALSVAVRLAEPEGTIRYFADEGAPMAELLSILQEQQHEQRTAPYLDLLLAAFSTQGKCPNKRQPKPKRPRQRAKKPLLDA